MSGDSRVGDGSGTALPLPLSSRMRESILYLRRGNPCGCPPTSCSGDSHVGADSETALPLPLSSRMRGPILPTPPTPIPVFVGGQPLWLPVYVVFGNSHVGAGGTALPLPLSSRRREPISTSVGATLVVARLRRVRQLPRRGGSGSALPLPLSSRMRGPIFPTPPTPIPISVGATLVYALPYLRRVPAASPPT